MGFKALQIFLAPGVTFHTTQWTVDEVWNHIPQISKKRRVPAEFMQENLMLLPLTVYGPAAYAHRLAEAQHRISDPKDEELLALALELCYPVWTNDKDFESASVTLYTTADLLTLLYPNG